MKTAEKIVAANVNLKTADRGYVCRLMSGDNANRPITVVAGKASPHMTGDSYYHTTPGGKLVLHPKAYGYPTIYHASTRHTVVGADWLLSSRNRVERRTDDGVCMIAMPGRTVRVGSVRIVPGWIDRRRYALIISGKRTYHVARGKMSDLRSDAPALVALALAAWDKQAEIVRTDRACMRDLNTTRVTLADSRRAGNCVEGSLQFAERKLGLSRSEVIAAGPLLGVPAQRVLAVANGLTEKAMGAIRSAWLRETQISI